MTSRVVLVTGGGTGIGAAVARRLTESGDRVVTAGAAGNHCRSWPSRRAH